MNHWIFLSILNASHDGAACHTTISPKRDPRCYFWIEFQVQASLKLVEYSSLLTKLSSNLGLNLPKQATKGRTKARTMLGTFNSKSPDPSTLAQQTCKLELELCVSSNMRLRYVTRKRSPSIVSKRVLGTILLVFKLLSSPYSPALGLIAHLGCLSVLNEYDNRHKELITVLFTVIEIRPSL